MTGGIVFVVVFAVFAVLALAACAFFLGPALIDAFSDTHDEWRELFSEALDEWRDLFEERKEKKAERKNK